MAPSCTNRSWIQVGSPINGDGSGGAGFTSSLSDDGKTVAVGTIWGPVRVYRVSNNVWSQLGNKIDPESPDDSARVVSISSDGNTVAIGAKTNDNVNGVDAGHVRVYRFNEAESTWFQLGQDIDGINAGDRSGQDVSLSSDGETVAIGAPYHNGELGHVMIFRLVNDSWSQLGSFIDGPTGGKWFGEFLDMSSDGKTVAAASRATNPQTVHVYRLSNDGSSWSQLGSTIEGSYGQLGHSLALSSDGNTIGVGVPGYNSAAGQVLVYQFTTYENGSDWVQLGSPINGIAANELSGYSMDISADGYTVIVGSPYNKQHFWNAGRVSMYRFDPNDSTWNQLGLDIIREAQDDEFGYANSVSISADGRTIAAGTHKHDSDDRTNNCHVRVFKFGGNC